MAKLIVSISVGELTTYEAIADCLQNLAATLYGPHMRDQNVLAPQATADTAQYASHGFVSPIIGPGGGHAGDWHVEK